MGAEKSSGPLDKAIYYPAFKAHDPRFDGRVFVGVSSTGVYCRPVCRVKMPKEENCAFYGSAAAEAAGYRPCLKCRPELAPGFAPVDAAARLSRKAALIIEEDCLTETSLEDLAAKLQVGSRHLRRVFKAEYGVSPVRYLQTRRLLLAKTLLTDSALPVTEIAFAAGFGSLRRFNDLFKKHYRLPPSALRKDLKPSGSGGGDSFRLLLGYRPPYDWDSLLGFLAGRAIAGVEAVRGGLYQRTAFISQGRKICRGWLSVGRAEKKNALAVTVSASLLPVLSRVLARVRQLFDLSCDPAEVYEKLRPMNRIKEGLCRPGVRVPGSFEPFEMAVRAVLGQQITVKAARTLAGRLAAAYGSPVATPIEGLTHCFPGPADLARLPGDIENHLGPLGVTGARARSIRALADGILSGDIELSLSADPDRQMEKLLALPGFGPWTVQYVALRALAWPDAFPHTDYGLKAALGGLSPQEILKLAEDWRPWRSYATVNLWNSL